MTSYLEGSTLKIVVDEPFLLTSPVMSEPTLVIMEGIYRADELTRYRTLIPSDRAVMELGSGWTSSLSVGKDIRQILYFVEKRM